MKLKGKPKLPPDTEERQQITTMAAAGISQNRIAEAISRSRHMVRNVLSEPEVRQAVQDEKAELSLLYRDKARDIVISINAADIAAASLQQKAVSSGILLDKSLLLAGEATSINVTVLMDVVEAMRARQQGRGEPSRQSPVLPSPEPL